MLAAFYCHFSAPRVILDASMLYTRPEGERFTRDSLNFRIQKIRVQRGDVMGLFRAGLGVCRAADHAQHPLS